MNFDILCLMASRQFELCVMPGGSSEMTGKLEKADKPVGKLTKLWADLVSVFFFTPRPSCKECRLYYSRLPHNA